MNDKMFVEVNSTVIVGSWYDNGLCYSKDNGKTWKSSYYTICTNSTKETN